jgi:hypothetical protein
VVRHILLLVCVFWWKMPLKAYVFFSFAILNLKWFYKTGFPVKKKKKRAKITTLPRIDNVGLWIWLVCYGYTIVLCTFYVSFISCSQIVTWNLNFFSGILIFIANVCWILLFRVVEHCCSYSFYFIY